MEDRDKEIIVATFYSHYGALLLKKNLGDCCCVRAVPRSLSSSCGTCAFIEGKTKEEVITASDEELLESIYKKDGEKFIKYE